MTKKIKMGMIGGSGQGFIGAVHRKAMVMDGEIDIVAGCFSEDPSRSAATGEALGLPPSRVYSSYQEMISTESSRPEEERIDFISIVTPNYLHFQQSFLALQSGFHVVCEKPLTFSVEEALLLKKEVQRSGLLFAVTHNYTGYPMVKEAKALIKKGALGTIRKVIGEYPQGWLAEDIENRGQKQAGWRTDPEKAGISCCVADIGTHIENLTEYITGLKIVEVAADVTTFVPGRLLDDDANILLRFDNGAKGVFAVSQVAAGEENELKIKIYGEKGSLEWLQSNPNQLIYKTNEAPAQILKAGTNNAYLSRHALAHVRTPGGHPEGYIESMANLYRNFAFAIRAEKGIGNRDKELYDFPSIDEGVRGLQFIEAVIHSSKKNSIWIKL